MVGNRDSSLIVQFYLHMFSYTNKKFSLGMRSDLILEIICLLLSGGKCNNYLSRFSEESFEKLLQENDQLYPNFCAKKPCGENSLCFDKGLTRYCRCKCGYSGNPSTGCYPLSPTKITRAEIRVNIQVSLPAWVTAEYLDIIMSNLAETHLAELYRNISIVVPGSAFITKTQYATCQ